jgi:hypothetical protein
MGGMGTLGQKAGPVEKERSGHSWRREGEGTARVDYVVFSFRPVPFVKGNSHPELCAQRTNEGGGFL